jgi:hypothetical protein
MTGGVRGHFLVSYGVKFLWSWVALIGGVLLAGRLRFAGLYPDRQKAFQIRSAPRQNQ